MAFYFMAIIITIFLNAALMGLASGRYDYWGGLSLYERVLIQFRMVQMTSEELSPIGGDLEVA